MHELILKPGKEKSFINRHPWVFSGAVAKLPSRAASGDIVVVKAHSGEMLGLGFFDAGSQIVCRIFEFGGQVFMPDRAYWQQKLHQAMALRKVAVPMHSTNCYRLCHAEGDFLPGLVIDVYAQCAVVEMLIPGTVALEDVWKSILISMGFHQIFLKKQNPSGVKSVAWEGTPTAELMVTELDLHYWVDIENGQKTGFFLDQRDNRALIQQYAHGRKVLNAFCYNGGFSLHAIKAGAAHTDSVDVSAGAITLTNKNVLLNFGTSAQHTGIVADCFEYLSQMPSDYDLIVLDPPAFAKKQGDVKNAARGYKEINLKALRKIRQGGVLFTFSCSQHIDAELFKKIIFGAAADAGRNVQILHHTTQPPDHPVSIYHPEGAYLKGLVLHVV
jgi:23S rRNA (cytosine1962-C5)-methyltransferase